MVLYAVSASACKTMKGLVQYITPPVEAYWWQQAPCTPPFGPTRETGVFAQFPPPESCEETDGVEGGASGGGNCGGGGDGGDGGDGGGAVYTHASAVTPDGGEHEPNIISEVPHPGIMRKASLHEQWL